MKNKKSVLYLFLIVLIFMGGNFALISFLDNIYLEIGLTIVLSVSLAIILYKVFNGNSLQEIRRYLSGINNMAFTMPKDAHIPDEIQEELNRFSNAIKNNLKTQVEISTEVFNVSEKLNIVSQESLSSAESIASSVEVADSNTIEQFNMLNKTNDLTHEICLSLENVEKDVISKIGFISDSITTAQKGIEDIQCIEERVNRSKDMTEKSSEQILKLKEYSDEIVSLIYLINSISRDTNMLSLNASIEAARAGEHGKGFAIVAMEVGKLAKETEQVSSKIEEVIYTLKKEIDSITKSMEEEKNYMEENCSVMENINREFKNVMEILNIGKKSLEEIKEVVGKNNSIIGEVTENIGKITSFSEEIATHMEETTAQVMEQHNRAKYLQEVVETIRDNVYDMQQFVAGKVMEERMLKEAYYIKEYLKANKNIDHNIIEELLKKTGMDALYITDPSGVVIHTSEKSAVGLNLYEADRSFLALKEGKQEYIVTPIKIRVEDGKLFKFLTVVDENKSLYEVGLSLESLF